jgi:polygalacturonase
MNFMAHRILIALCFIAYSHAATFEVKSFGTDRVAINKAIDAADAAGGGVVNFSPGVYVTGSIHLEHRTRRSD